MDPIVPKDMLLPLPAPVWLLVALLLVSFAVHILFVNLMVGSSLLVMWTEIKGLKKKDWDKVSHQIAETITVNKSLAVVFGVAPLLTISVLYTAQFYSSSTLLGHSWLMVIPLVILAFLFTYAHKYSWNHLQHSKGVHLTLVGIACALFLSIPFIFLSNINLMLYPEHWARVHSFWDALWLPNVLPRYIHFLMAALALTGLFFVYYFGRKPEKQDFGSLKSSEVVRVFYGVALAATGAQILFGLLVFFTLPSHVISLRFLAILCLVLTLVPFALWWLWREVRADQPGARFWPIVLLLGGVVALMIWARHEVRENAVSPHRALVAAKTSEYRTRMTETQDYILMPGGLGGTPASPGSLVFTRRCASCHSFDRRLVGPALNEAIASYRGNPQGLMTWIVKPGRKRPDYPAMPAQEMPRDELQQLVEFVLQTTG
ncbi:MAG: cytochrome C [Acidobacteria bacterium]|nr:MAG: cytochrome C [Acidobacteriota bacterium]